MFYILQVTMADKEGAEKACANPNPMIDGRKANVNLAYLGAKPKLHGSQPGNTPSAPGRLHIFILLGNFVLIAAYPCYKLLVVYSCGTWLHFTTLDLVCGFLSLLCMPALVCGVCPYVACYHRPTARLYTETTITANISHTNFPNASPTNSNTLLHTEMQTNMYLELCVFIIYDFLKFTFAHLWLSFLSIIHTF
jgi:hypothetical protein